MLPFNLRSIFWVGARQTAWRRGALLRQHRLHQVTWPQRVGRGCIQKPTRACNRQIQDKMEIRGRLKHTPRIHLSIHLSIYLPIYLSVYIYTHIPAMPLRGSDWSNSKYVAPQYMNICMNVHICMNMHRYRYVYIYIHTHRYIYVYTDKIHVYIRMRGSFYKFGGSFLWVLMRDPVVSGPYGLTGTSYCRYIGGIQGLYMGYAT